MNFLTDSLNMSCRTKNDISLQVVEVRPNLLWGEDGTGADVVHSLALHIGRPEHLLSAILKGRKNKKALTIVDQTSE